MAVDDTGEHAPANEVCPLIGIHFGAGEAEGGLAAESNAVGFAAEGAAVLCEAHFFRIAATEHLLDNFIMVAGAVERAVRGRECVPVVTEDLLEGVLVDAGFYSQAS